MSQFRDRLPSGRARHLVTAAAAVLAVVIIAAGGSLVGAEPATYDPGRIPVVGRTRAICTVTPTNDERQTTVGAAVMRRAPGRAGSLSGHPIDATNKTLSIKEQGLGQALTDRKATLLMAGEGVMATASAGTVVTTADKGDDQGISAAPCTPPAVDHWFVGVGYTDNYRSELMITNPDDNQAEVDLRFFGAKGQIVVPGGQGLLIPGKESVTVGLESLIDAEGPLSVSVHATEGRVSAMSRDQRNVEKKKKKGGTKIIAGGADWHASSIGPRRQVIVPGIPEGDGSRQLVVVNPGTVRATVQVEVLGSQGPYAPVGAETLTIEPESTAAVQLEDALGGAAAGVRLSSDQPITASVGSISERDKADPDIAVEVAEPPVTMNAIAASALLEGATSTVQLSNNADADVTVSLQVVSYSGQTLHEADVPMLPGTSDTRELRFTGPAYLVVKAPDGSQVHASLTISQPEGDIAGLTTTGLLSPDLASRAPDLEQDPGTAR